MTDSLRPEDDASAQPRSARRDDGHTRFSGLEIAKALAAVGILILIAFQPAHYWGSALEALLAGSLLVSIIWGLVRPNKLEREMKRLGVLVGEVRQGHEPIELLSEFDAPLMPLAQTCRDLLRDIRQERSRIAELQDEVRQRIASRTESLERTIGALRQQAAKDSLTGLFNRRMLDAYLPDAIERCKANATPFSLLMIDIDYFKPLNDTLGHAAGDQMLKSVAQIIRSTIRESDLAFRIGGDEFVIVLEGCPSERTRVLADRLSSLGDALGRTFRLTPPPTLSVGMITLTELNGATASTILHQGDAALYQVKAAHHAAVLAPPRSRRAG
jgi:diguanylate cyclase (GGDEF)-like protein